MRDAVTVLLLSLAAQLWLAESGQTAAARVATATSTAALLRADMTLPNELRPHGVPASSGWAARPRLNRGANATGFKALTSWGQVYECASGNPQPEVQTELQGIQTFVLSKRTRKWRRLNQLDQIDGAAYHEDYAGDVHTKTATSQTPSGGIAVSVGRGRNFHFWPKAGRATIDPSDVGAVVALVRARLVAATVSEKKRTPCIILSVGADYWRTLTARWGGTDVNNSEVGIGRFKRVDTNWRVFTMATSWAAIPPSINLAASETR